MEIFILIEPCTYCRHCAVDEALAVRLIEAPLQVLLQLNLLAAYGVDGGIATLDILADGAIGGFLALAGAFGQVRADLAGRIRIPIEAGRLTSRRKGARLSKRHAQLGHDHAKQSRLVGHAGPGAGLQWSK